MTIEIGKNYRGNLQRVKMMAADAFGSSPKNLAHILISGSNLTFINPIREGYCYQCRRCIENNEGFRLVIIDKGEDFASEEIYFFHYLHFQ